MSNIRLIILSYIYIRSEFLDRKRVEKLADTDTDTPLYYIYYFILWEVLIKSLLQYIIQWLVKFSLAFNTRNSVIENGHKG
jgi:hypothetical protein